jgi:RNA polymerase sigma factor (sigma-70 family)
MSADDSALMGRLARGDTSALTVLYERYSRVVYARAFSAVDSRADAEELMQDVFLLLWKKRKRVTIHGESALPWLLVSVRFLALNRKRHNDRRSTYSLSERKDIDGGADPARIVARSRFIEVIEASIAKLGPVDRAILQLCVVEGLTYKEAAVRLKTSHAVVRNRLGRARAAVRADASAYLGEEG